MFQIPEADLHPFFNKKKSTEKRHFPRTTLPADLLTLATMTHRQVRRAKFSGFLACPVETLPTNKKLILSMGWVETKILKAEIAGTHTANQCDEDGWPLMAHESQVPPMTDELWFRPSTKQPTNQLHGLNCTVQPQIRL